MAKPSALEEFIIKRLDIDKHINRLSNISDELHFDCAPEDIHWGHVGDLDYIEKKLKEIVDKVFQEGEYALENNQKH